MRLGDKIVCGILKMHTWNYLSKNTRECVGCGEYQKLNICPSCKNKKWETYK